MFGGELAISTFGESGGDDPAMADKVMHGQLETASGFTLMAADMPPQMPHNPGDTISISLSGGPEDKAELRGYYEALTGGGKVVERSSGPRGATSSACASTASARRGW